MWTAVDVQWVLEGRHQGVGLCSYFRASRTFFPSASISRAFRAGNGRAMATKEMIALSPTLTSKVPFRGFSALISTTVPALPSLMIFSSFVARVLNAPQDLQASMLTFLPPLALFFAGPSSFLATLAFSDSTGASALRLPGILRPDS